MENKDKVALLLSGGVDSSVAGALLCQQGYDVTAYYLKIWLEDDFQFLGSCPFEEDLKFARAVCEKLNIPLKIVSLQSEYWSEVVAYAIDELKNGATPSPDLLCNQKIKFGAFVNHLSDDFKYIASGHYALLDRRTDLQVQLRRSPDEIKDQTYFLSQMSLLQLRKCLFPLGPYTKSQVRQLAVDFKLPNARRPDSQGICFLGKIKFRDFVAAHLNESPGEIIDIATQRKVGLHKGYWFHTIGQRKGLGLSGGPWFVVDKDVNKNIVYVAHDEILDKYPRTSFFLNDIHWIDSVPDLSQQLGVKLRHGPKILRCSLEKKEGWICYLDQSDHGIASGQFAVFYDLEGGECLGSGRIFLGEHLN